MIIINHFKDYMSCIYSVFHYCRTLLNIIVLHYSLIVHYHHGIIISKCQDITDIDNHIDQHGVNIFIIIEIFISYSRLYSNYIKN